MTRKKNRPIRSGSLISAVDIAVVGAAADVILETDGLCGKDACQENGNSRKPFFVNVEQCSLASEEHFDVAEIVLDNVNFSNVFKDDLLEEDCCGGQQFFLRFCLLGVEESSFRLGHFPLISADSILLEYVLLGRHNLDGNRETTIIFSGVFDGPDESISGLVHLVTMKLLGVRLMLEDGKVPNYSPIRIRVELLEKAFEACESLLEIVRQPWRRSMMSVMSWLRPEVTMPEVIYGVNRAEGPMGYEHSETNISSSRENSEFDAAGFYEAIKPSKEEPMWEVELPDLLPCLRPYQRRAVYWMVNRELGTSAGKLQQWPTVPICLPIMLLGGQRKMFYNSFIGNISCHPVPSSYVSGGILADEMGLGKTVELLACIFANRKLSMEEVITDNEVEDAGCQMKRQKRERVECICGAASETSKYEGMWVQCDICDAWQHADCVGYSPKNKSSFSSETCGENSSDVALHAESKFRKKQEESSIVIEMDGSFICSLCAELMEAAKIKISTGATLVVCPGSILAQWHSEIIRHTRPGSVKVCIYEGAKNISTSTTLKCSLSELATADIVLTSYDILKEDLSHDSDRHNGDRHFLRFQKRYPVIPTLLTRIHWWRVCLDEAQMVECNTASVSEMALRLHTQHRWCITGTPIQRRLDDLFGLLRFLKASPFDVYRWWVEVIRDPYERKDLVATEFIHKMFKQVMWRSSKFHVSEELQLPPQEECLRWLTLSPIEEHFYQKQHETCVSHAKEIIESFRNNDHATKIVQGSEIARNSFLSHDEVAKLLWPLLKLRQACCHPQVGSSGLCSLENSPLSMDEILEVLIGKSKIEGEEALRRVVVATNGLAGLAVIEQDNERAIFLYKEALAIADENHDDFRLDPLLNLHIHHNLAELVSLSSEPVDIPSHLGMLDSEANKNKRHVGGKYGQHYVKRQRINDSCKLVSVTKGEALEQHAITNSSAIDCMTIEHSSQSEIPGRADAASSLRGACESIKQKYLSSFISKLYTAQQEFKAAYNEVCSLLEECKVENMCWWIHALDNIEQKKELADELMRKIEQSISRVTNNSRSFKISSGFRSMKCLKYTIQCSLDSLQTSRQALINRLLQIDQTMEKPNHDDIERVRYCPYCGGGNGSLCIHCELDKLFQIYEAKLFLLRKGNDSPVIASVEEALDHQKRKDELNSFFRDGCSYIRSDVSVGESKQRYAKANIQVLRHPSELELTLAVIKSCSKAILGRQGVGSARKHLLLFEAMRREFTHARLLSRSQAQLLRAHDEIKLSTSRLRLKETEDEPAAINILSKEELIPHSMQFSSDKFASMSSLSCIKGQLRYLKGLVKCKVETPHRSQFSSSTDQDQSNLKGLPPSEIAEVDQKIIDDLCPICHEKLDSQKMVFECGHVICCKCCLHLTEDTVLRSGKYQRKWLMCPTCRQCTEIEHVAYVDEKQNMDSGPRASKTFDAQDLNESSIAVQGSYGTKIEAVTRRILWIKSTNQDAKVLVFSSWNDVLDVLQHAMDANAISYVRMKGGRKSQAAIAQFKGESISLDGRKKIDKSSKSKHVQVLLILIQHGAKGLNLLEAQHVILVEPLLNPAVEAQAISRVHRIGQDKKTFVHRFIVKNTVEESIYKLNKSRSGNSIVSTKSIKNQDQAVLTIRDVESLFPSLSQLKSVQEDQEEMNVETEGNMRHLPPAVAAGLAAERRLTMFHSSSQ